MSEFLEGLLESLGPMRWTLKGFAVETVLAGLILLHYRRFGSAISSRQSFGPVIPFVALTTFLVISIVRSSFALSLGMVGALSIVRFRTPVKDPDELAYVFLAIASGIGTAAGQLALTSVIVVLTLLLLAIVRRTVAFRAENVFISVNVPGVADVEAAFKAVTSVLQANSARSGYVRYEMHDAVLHLTAEADLPDPEAMARITSQLRARYPSTNVTFYDETSMPTP